MLHMAVSSPVSGANSVGFKAGEKIGCLGLSLFPPRVSLSGERGKLGVYTPNPVSYPDTFSEGSGS